MRRRALVATIAAIVGLGAAFHAGSSRGGDAASSVDSTDLPSELRLENLPDRIGVTSADGQQVGYVDKHLLLALTRGLPVPDGYDVRGPFPVYDEAGKEIGTYDHDSGYRASDDEDPDPGRAPVTTTTHGGPSP